MAKKRICKFCKQFQKDNYLVLHCRNKLVAETVGYRAVGRDDGVELGRGALQHVICETEGGDGVCGSAFGLDSITSLSTYVYHLEESRAIELVAIYAE